jgi:thiamine pyrophosphokinase
MLNEGNFIGVCVDNFVNELLWCDLLDNLVWGDFDEEVEEEGED